MQAKRAFEFYYTYGEARRAELSFWVLLLMYTSVLYVLYTGGVLKSNIAKKQSVKRQSALKQSANKQVLISNIIKKARNTNTSIYVIEN